MAWETWEEDVEVARGGDVGTLGYITDTVITGPAKGLSLAVRGLLEMGAMPIDYLANTNLLTGIENIFEGDGFLATPDTKTALGDITSVITQFGVPYVGALKIANGLSKMKSGAGFTMTKLGSLSKAGKAAELTKRAGYFGGIGGVVDFAVSTPSELGTLSDITGITEQTDYSGLEGRDRAIETIKGKAKFGAEGAVLGAGVTLLPQAASLGFRYGIIPAAKTLGYVGGKALNVIDYPLTGAINAIVGKKDKSILQEAIIAGRTRLSDAGKKIAGDKEWRYVPAEGGLIDHVKRGIIKLRDQFDTYRGQDKAIRDIQVDLNLKFGAEQKTLTKIGEAIQEGHKDIVDKYKVIFNRDGDSLLKLQLEDNKVHNLLLATSKNEKREILKTIPKDVRKNVMRFDKLIDAAATRFSAFTSGITKKDALQSLAADYALYSKRNFAAFNNKKFEFNPLLEKNAIKEFKNIIRTGDKDVLAAVRQEAVKIAKGATSGKVYDDAYEQALDKFAKRDMLAYKQKVISGAESPEFAFNELNKMWNVTEKTKGEPLRAFKGEDLPDAVKRMLSVEKGRTGVELSKRGIKDSSGKLITEDVKTWSAINAGLDVALQQSKQMYGKKAFDGILKAGLRTGDNVNGAIFDAAAMARLGSKTRLVDLSKIGRKENFSDLVMTSDLFNGKYYAAPELAHALVGAKEATAGLYSLPFYKGLMTLKAGAQISKTILSPMTQIRNFTTAAMFPMASGLIGGRIGFKDAWRLTGEDIFAGAKTDIERIARIERLIERGVIDQNVNLAEMRRVLESAKNGKLDFQGLMNSPAMKKLTDVYQGADNYWKIYSDNFYQGALGTAFSRNGAMDATALMKMPAGSKKDAAQAAFFRNIDDWFTTVTGSRFEKINTFTGAAKTPLEALEEASAYLVTNTIPTYSKVPKLIENIRNLPLGNFIAFPAEILRTSSNIFSLGTRELTSTNPYIRQMGMRRLVGLSTVLGGVGYTVKKGAQYVTGVDDATMEAFQTYFAPTYQKNSTLIPMTAPDENGDFKYYNFSYSNPYDTLVAPVNAVIGAFSDGSLNKSTANEIIYNALFGELIGGDGQKRKGAIAEFITPFVTESIGTERVTDILPVGRNGKTRTGKVIYFEQDSPDVKLAKSINHVFGGLTPGAVTSAQRVWEGATGKFTDYGTQRDGVAEIAALMSGVRLEDAKPLSSMPFILTSYGKDKGLIRSKFAKTAYSARTSPENKIAAWKQYVLENYANQTQMFNTINAAEELGISSRELRKILEQRLTKTESKTLIRGEFKSPTYSVEAFEQIAKRLEGEDPFKADEIKEQNEIVMDIFKDSQKDLRDFELGRSMEELEQFIDQILSPGVEESREIVDTSVAPTGGAILERQAVLPVSPALTTPVNNTIVNNQMAAANTLGARYLGGINYNRMNTAQKADYADKVFKTTV
jgi:hypothetical protein